MQCIELSYAAFFSMDERERKGMKGRKGRGREGRRKIGPI
jgi:hypothetical protein